MRRVSYCNFNLIQIRVHLKIISVKWCVCYKACQIGICITSVLKVSKWKSSILWTRNRIHWWNPLRKSIVSKLDVSPLCVTEKHQTNKDSQVLCTMSRPYPFTLKSRNMPILICVINRKDETHLKANWL